jgi:hypothetical protein
MNESASLKHRNVTLTNVREELGLPESVANDLEGLRTVYSAWCANMTFDNMRKFVSLRS